MTEQDYENCITGYRVMREALYDFAQAYLTKYGARKGQSFSEITKLELSDDTIEICTETYWNGSDTEYKDYTLPASYLWTDWKAREEIRREIEAKKVDIAQKEMRKAKAEKAKADRKKQYDKLREEFGNGD